MALISQWLLDDNLSDTDVVDSQAANAGVLAGGDDTEDVSIPGPIGKINTGFALNGTDDYVDLASAPAIARTYAITGWFKTGYGGATKEYICGFTNQPTNDRRSSVYIESGILKGNITQTSSVTVAGSNVADGRWHYFALVAVSGGNDFLLYIDDALVDSGTAPSGPTSSAVVGTIGQLELTAGLEANGFWSGSLADIRVHDAALTAAQVQTARKEMLGLAVGSQNSLFLARVAYDPNSLFRDNGSPMA